MKSFRQLVLVIFSVFVSSVSCNFKSRTTTKNSRKMSMNYNCPGQPCEIGGAKCVASTCSCGYDQNCTCQQTQWYLDKPNISQIEYIFCKNYLNDGEKCIHNISCKSSCCSNKTSTCINSDGNDFNSCKSDYNNGLATDKRRRQYRRELRRTNYTVPTEFSLIPNITISLPKSNKCWADGSCVNAQNPNKADVFGGSVRNGMVPPIRIPGLGGIAGIRPNDPIFLGRFGNQDNIEFECGDGTQECENSCCSYGFCIDPTNDCTPYTAKASFYSLYTFISLAGFCIVYWVLFWWFGIEYAKQASVIHPEFSRDKIIIDNNNILQNQPHVAVSNREIVNLDNTRNKEDKKSNSQSKDVSLSHGIYPNKDEFNEKPI